MGDALKRVLILGLRGYQIALSPMIGPRCRHLPTCSAYAVEALEGHGVARGSWLALRRLARCHPFGTSGYDPVPAPVRGSRKASCGGACGE